MDVGEREDGKRFENFTLRERSDLAQRKNKNRVGFRCSESAVEPLTLILICAICIMLVETRMRRRLLLTAKCNSVGVYCLPQNVTAVVGAQVNFTCTANSIPAPEVTWKKGDIDLEPEQVQNSGGFTKTSRYTIESVEYEARGDYTCLFRNYRGNVSGTAHLTVHGK